MSGAAPGRSSSGTGALAVADTPGRAPTSRFQVLSLDGGGIRGIFTAALLVGLERDLGRPVIDHFDLVVGTSTGGLVAIALGAGLSAEEILDLYVREKATIFPGPQWARRLKQFIGPKYSPRGLEAVLRTAVGDRLLGESRVPLVIPSFDLGENGVYLFKTPHHKRLKRDWKVPMWQVAMATCAAPTYFPAYELPSEHVRLVDGGVWASNPACVGVAEAVSMFEQPLDTLRVLSLGTTADSRTRRRSMDNAGIIQWLRGRHIVNILMTGQSIGAFTQVQHLVGPQHARRLDPPAPDGLNELDVADARDLKAKAAFHSRTFCPTFESIFADHTPAPYVPRHGPAAQAR